MAPFNFFIFLFSLQFEDLVSIIGTKFGDSVKSKMALGTGSNEKQIFNFIRRHFAIRQLNSEMSWMHVLRLIDIVWRK
jgi:hypothetical protein